MNTTDHGHVISIGNVISDLHRAPGNRKALKLASRTFFCQQHFHHEDSAQYFSFWSADSFYVHAGQCNWVDFDQIKSTRKLVGSLPREFQFVFYFCACLVLLTFDDPRCKSRELHGAVFVEACETRCLPPAVPPQ